MVKIIRIIILSEIIVLFSFQTQAQLSTINITDCENILMRECLAPESVPIWAIKDVNGGGYVGKIVFTPGGKGWEFSWKFGQGIVRTDGEYDRDSSVFTVEIAESGIYSFNAEKKDGTRISSGNFRIVYSQVGMFGVSLLDSLDCTAIGVRAKDLSLPESPCVVHPQAGTVAWVYKDGTRVLGPITFNPGSPVLFSAVEVDCNNASFSIRVRDCYGFEWESSPKMYTSVIPDAKMKLRLLNTVEINGGSGDNQGQAPLEVEFRDDNSVNAQEFKWFLFKDTSDLKEYAMTFEDSLIDNRVVEGRNFNYTYENSGQYKVVLKTVNTNGQNMCSDTTSQHINVFASLINVPNVFTPNGDGKNDIFRAQTLSVESFQAVIINRWGRKVYEWTDPQGGWDGRINGKYASPGTYYYIITAKGLERGNPVKYVKKGALLLVR